MNRDSGVLEETAFAIPDPLAGQKPAWIGQLAQQEKYLPYHAHREFEAQDKGVWAMAVV